MDAVQVLDKLFLKKYKALANISNIFFKFENKKIKDNFKKSIYKSYRLKRGII